jgi:hypothetical protein
MPPEPVIIDYEDATAVFAMLQAADTFRCIDVPDLDPNDWNWIREKKQRFGTEFCLVFDRNVFTRVLGLRQPLRRPLAQGERIAAAVMFHGIMGNVLFDSGPAIAEALKTQGPQDGCREACAFAAMQNLDPAVYLNIALGRLQGVAPEMIEAEITPEILRGVEQLDLSHQRWMTPEYTCALKLALLQLRGGGKGEATVFSEFLQWSYEEFLFLPGPLIYGSLALSPGRKSRMFKNLRGTDPVRALSGIRNAAWDMYLLRYWVNCVKRQHDDNSFHFLGTMDQALKDCAADLLVPSADPEIARIALRERWTAEWGKHATTLLAQYESFALSYQTDHNRTVASHQHDESFWRAYHAQLLAEVEAELGKT